MVSKNFTPVNWSNGQLIDEDSLDQINNNEVYLRDRSVQGKYMFDWGASVDQGIKVMAGRIYIPAQNVEVVYGTVGFPQLFTPDIQPIVVTNILSPGQNKFMHIVYGIGTYFPDHRGFQFKINVRAGQSDNQVFSNPIYLQYHALGY